jgi:uncharacterized membrane protein YdjX (TVP38/TMEM64 family)
MARFSGQAPAFPTTIVRSVQLVAIGLLVGLAVWLLPVGSWLDDVNRLLEWLEARGVAGLLAFIAIFAIASVLFLPTPLFALGGGLVFGVVRGFLGVTLGATLGAALAFLIGRYLAREKVRVMIARRPGFRAIDRAVGQQGWRIVLMTRLSPLIPFNVQNYLYGLTSVGFLPFVIATWLGRIPGTLVYLYLGAAGRAGLEAAEDGEPSQTGMWRLGLYAAGIAVTAAVAFHVARLARRAIREAEAAAP